MTEAKWLACSDPEPMLTFLLREASARKCRLFAVACCRRIWDSLTQEGLRETVLAVERLADQAAREEDWLAAREPAEAVVQRAEQDGRDAPLAYSAVLSAAGLNLQSVCRGTAKYAAVAVGLQAADSAHAVRDAEWGHTQAVVQDAESAAQAVLLRDLFNPVTVHLEKVRSCFPDFSLHSGHGEARVF